MNQVHVQIIYRKPPPFQVIQARSLAKDHVFFEESHGEENVEKEDNKQSCRFEHLRLRTYFPKKGLLVAYPNSIRGVGTLQIPVGKSPSKHMHMHDVGQEDTAGYKEKQEMNKLEECISNYCDAMLSFTRSFGVRNEDPNKVNSLF